jgi:flagellar hook-associated protein 3 FlgL
MSSVGATGPVIVTPGVMSGALVGDLTNDQASIATLENEISTGDAVTSPSDNPAQVANILQLQSGVVRANQYESNAQDGVSWLSLANSTVGSVLSVLQKVQSTVESISGSNLSGTPSTVAGISDAITSALKQLANLANTQYAGQAIFAGTGNATQAYSSTGTYLGAGTSPTRTVAPGSQVAVSVTGPTIFGSGPTGLLSTVPGNLGVLAQIVQDLKAGTPTSIRAATTTGLGALQSAISTVETAAGTLGANEQAMQGFATQATASVTALQQELGAAQDVNMAQAITNLQLQQTSYQAALYATSQLHTDSLAQYL